MALGLAALSLLVVDDNKAMRSIIGTVLAAAGVRTLHYAVNGREALSIMDTVRNIDVIFADHEMPVMNGLDFVRIVRSRDGPERFVPVIMVTGHSDLARLNAARDCGVTEFLRKPVNAHDILARLESAILRPRPYVESPDYFGPDRRRHDGSGYRGPKRRQGEPDAGNSVEV